MESLTITKFVFDRWWTGTYIDCLTRLLPQEVEALVDHHWKELQATAIRHSLRETKEDCGPTEGCNCGANVDLTLTAGSPPWFHMSDCPLYQAPQ